jgi:hypothetical protein
MTAAATAKITMKVLGSTTGRMFPGEVICGDGIVSDGIGSSAGIGSSCEGRLASHSSVVSQPIPW